MRYIILGERYRSILDSPLRDNGYKAVYMPDNPNIDERLAGHADLSVFQFAEKKLLLAPYLKNTEFVKQLTALGVECCFLDIAQTPQYPNDTQMNACLFDKFLFCSPGITDKSLLEVCPDKEKIRVKQGYCRCSICAVGDKAIICADQGVLSAAKEKNICSLQINPGYVELDGFPYGFVGGASFVGEDRKILFTGLLHKHPDGEKMLEFIKLHGYSPVFLTNYPIFDIGTCIPI